MIHTITLSLNHLITPLIPMQLITFYSEQEFIANSVSYIKKICASMAQVSMALSGGTTPKPIYEMLAQQTDIDWSHINFFQVDERNVLKDHPDSNYRLIQESLISRVPRVNGWHFFDTSLPIEETLKKYEAEVHEHQPFNLCILGLGPDGHTASLFPHSGALHETKRLVAHTTTDQFPIQDRLTLTFPAIMPSKKLLLLVKGENKKQILDDLLESNKSIDQLPAKKLLEHPDLTIHYCTI